jgi:hypothetical protein
VLLCHLPPTESSANDLLWPNAPQYDGQTDDAVRRLHGRMRARYADDHLVSRTYLGDEGNITPARGSTHAPYGIAAHSAAFAISHDCCRHAFGYVGLGRRC